MDEDNMERQTKKMRMGAMEENLTVVVKEEPGEHSDFAPVGQSSDFLLSQQSQKLFFEVPSLSLNQIEDSSAWSASCSTSRVIQVPFEPTVAAELTSTIDIKREPSDEEKDSDCDDDKLKDPEADVSSDHDDDMNFRIWSEDSSSMRTLPFSKRQSVRICLPTDPYDIFRLFINDELVDLVVGATNESGRTTANWEDVSREELLKFIGLLIHTGTIHMPRLSDYWKTHYLFNLPCFSMFMARSRFMQIMNSLSFSRGNSSKDRPDRTLRVKPVIDHFNRTMGDFYYPGANLLVTEAMTLYKGGLLLRESKGYDSRNDEKRLGIRIHFLIESTGIIYKLHVTDGVLVQRQVVLALLNENLDCGHSVYLSEQYNSSTLSADLLERKTHCTGPLSQSDSGVCSLLKSLDIASPQDVPGNISYYRNGVHICKVKNLFFLSTQHDNEMIHVPTNQGVVAVKSKLVAMYHSVMECDNQEEFMSYYPCRSNHLKWHKRLFIHVLHQTIINAYQLLLKSKQMTAKAFTFYSFRLNILEKLLPMAVIPPPAVTESHVLTKIENFRIRQRVVQGGHVFRREVVRKECRSCRQAKKRTATSFECRRCDGCPGYCMECFCKVHKLTK